MHSSKTTSTVTLVLAALLVAARANDSPHGEADEILTSSSGIKFVRSPPSRFPAFEDFPYETKYADVLGLRMAYIDEGAPAAKVMLLLHGEPDWAYLYHLMIPIYLRAGYRVIAPDLIGFGRSDKPVDRAVYTSDNHVLWMKRFMAVLELKGVNAFIQDWGGLIGLTLAAEHGHLFDKLILANTGLPTGMDIPGFQDWVNFSQNVDPFVPSEIMDMATSRKMTDKEKAAFDAPFPSELYLAGARQFPLLVPVRRDQEGVERFLRARKKMSRWTKPVLLLWGLRDPLARGAYSDLRSLIPGTEGQPHRLYPDANHFIQLDVGEELAVASVQWLYKLSGRELEGLCPA